MGIDWRSQDGGSNNSPVLRTMKHFSVLLLLCCVRTKIVGPHVICRLPSRVSLTTFTCIYLHKHILLLLFFLEVDKNCLPQPSIEVNNTRSRTLLLLISNSTHNSKPSETNKPRKRSQHARTWRAQPHQRAPPLLEQYCQHKARSPGAFLSPRLAIPYISQRLQSRDKVR